MYVLCTLHKYAQSNMLRYRLDKGVYLENVSNEKSNAASL